MLTLAACVSEKDEPPGCNTPLTPAIDAPIATFYEGQYGYLYAMEPTDASGGTFEWIGPNNFISHDKSVSLGKMSVRNSGLYKLFYLDKNMCRSNPATVFIALNSEAGTCNLPANFARLNSINETFVINRLNKTQVNGRFALDVQQEDINIRVIFPEPNRPSKNKLYKIAADSISFADDEIFVKINWNGNRYIAENNNKNVQFFLGDENKFYVVLCQNNFVNTSGTAGNINASFNLMAE